jgi:hypothetical protein
MDLFLLIFNLNFKYFLNNVYSLEKYNHAMKSGVETKIMMMNKAVQACVSIGEEWNE